MTLQATLAKVQKLKKIRQEKASRALQKKARLDQERQLAKDRQGSTEPPKLSDFWKPNPGPQAQFFNSTCHEVLYGGAAGGGKSAAITALPLKWAHIPGFSALTLRRTFKQGKQLRKYSRQLYQSVFPGLKPIKSENYLWPFPSGAEASYGHCQNEDDHEQYDGEEIHLLCFDELTHFTETQYLYISGRVRSSDPRHPTYIRATTNPGGPGHDWVFKRWGAWLNPDFQAPGLEARYVGGVRVPSAKPGEVLFIETIDGVEHYHREDGPRRLSRTFIPAMLADNPHMGEEYQLQIDQMDPVRRAQLGDGDWLIKPAAGLYFKRRWVEIIPEAPEGVRWIRNWDLAATEPNEENKDPDWTRGVKIGKLGSTIFIGGLESCRSTPGSVADLIKTTAGLDGHSVSIGLPQDPGQAGKSQVSQYVELLEGFTVLSETESGDKVTRFGPFSTQAEHGNVKLIKGDWNEELIRELEAFPTKGVHDDIVDAVSGGYRKLTSGAANFIDAMNAFESRE